MQTKLFSFVVMSALLLAGAAASAKDLNTIPLHAGTSGYDFRCTACNTHPTSPTKLFQASVAVEIIDAGPAANIAYVATTGTTLAAGFCTTVTGVSTTFPSAYCHVHTTSTAKISTTFELVDPSTGRSTVTVAPY